MKRCLWLTVIGLLMLLVLAGCAQQTATIHGVVVDRQGNPAGIIGVIYRGHADTTDANGRFILEQVPAGSGEIVMLARSKVPVTIPVVIAEGVQTLTLTHDADYNDVVTPRLDFLFVWRDAVRTDLDDTVPFTYVFAPDLKSLIKAETGIDDLPQVISYLQPAVLQYIGHILGVRHLVWVSEYQDTQLQIFAVDYGVTNTVPFRRSSLGSVFYEIREPLLAYLAGSVRTGVPNPVIGNIESGVYHAADADHLPPHHLRAYFGSRKEAEEAGYRPDPLCFSAPATAHRSELPGTEAELARRVTSLMEGRYRVIYSGAEVEWIKRVAATLIPVTERPNLSYTFAVLDTHEYNAFALPGGYIYITRPLLNIIESDAELAAVLAHEMVHIAHMHAVQNYERQIAMTVAAVFLGVATGQMEAAADLIDSLSQILDQGYNYAQEYEADAYSQVYLMKAGYSTEATNMVLRKLRPLQLNLGSSTKSYTQTHPPTDSRLERAIENQQNLAYYQVINDHLRY
jgi:hypothetical protein